MSSNSNLLTALVAALSGKYTYKTPHGIVTTEDLYDLGKEDLNTTAKDYNRILKSEDEEDFLNKKTYANVEVQNKFDIVKSILEDKIAADEAATEAIKNKPRVDALLAEKARRQGDAITELSDDELEAELAKKK